MFLNTKGEICYIAFSRIGISGVASTPTGEDIDLAISTLESMMYEWEANGIHIGYNFTNTPNVNDTLGIPPQFTTAVQYNLALRLIPDFEVEINPVIMKMASSSYSSMLAMRANEVIRDIPPARRMGRGSGNTYRFQRWNRFNYPAAVPSVYSETIRIDETKEFTFDATALTDGAAIDTVQVSLPTPLTVNSTSIDGAMINYTVTADGRSDSTLVYIGKIIVNLPGNIVRVAELQFEVKPKINV